MSIVVHVESDVDKILGKKIVYFRFRISLEVLLHTQFQKILETLKYCVYVLVENRHLNLQSLTGSAVVVVAGIASLTADAVAVGTVVHLDPFDIALDTGQSMDQ